MKKRWLSILCLLLAALCFVGPAAAEGIYGGVSENRNTIANYDAVYAAMFDAIASGETTLSVYEWRISVPNLMKIFADLFAAAPEFFFLTPRVTYHTADGLFGETVVDVTFEYTMDREAREAASAFFDSEIRHIVSLVPPGLSEAERALFVHDYLVSVYAYDEEENGYDTYTFLRTREGVCQAYSLVYMTVLEALGMEAAVVTSPSMNHAWNIVKIDGRWYHADLIYDDPKPDRPGRVLHDWFLLSDGELRARGRTGWTSTVKCPDPWQDRDPVWKGVASRMLSLGGQWYYIANEERKLMASTFDGTGLREVYRFRERWTLGRGSGRWWVGTFSGLSENRGVLFVNTPREIVYYDPATGKSGTYLRGEPGESIYGSSIYKNTLAYMTAASPDPAGEERLYSVTILGDPETRSADAMPFCDVNLTDPWYDAVKFVWDRGFFAGVSTTRFAPRATLTRAMFVTVLGRLCGADPEERPDSFFSDVEPGLWYSGYVNWAAECGIVNGVGGGRFDPLGELTVEQMLKIAAKTAGILGAGEAAAVSALAGTPDVEEVSDWARESAAWCVTNGLAPARTPLNPKSPAKRAEAAAVTAAFAELIESND